MGLPVGDRGPLSREAPDGRGGDWRDIKLSVNRRHAWIAIAVAVALVGATRAPAQGSSPFLGPAGREIAVAASPRTARSAPLPAGSRPIGLAVAPDGPDAAIILRQKGDQIWLWDTAKNALDVVWRAPAGAELIALAWHPMAGSLFVAERGPHQGYAILKLVPGRPLWRAVTVYRSSRPIVDLVAGPRPFAPILGKEAYFRLFFGERGQGGAVRTLSVTEAGKVLYQVLGPEASRIDVPGGDAGEPTNIAVPWAEPVAFHPAGHILLWRDRAGCYHAARYDDLDWGKSSPLLGGDVCGGAVIPIPNGMGLLRWRPGRPGVTVMKTSSLRPSRLAGDHRFALPPAPTPDGAGLVSVEQKAAGYELDFLPIALPLSNVVNAWMFASKPQDLDDFTRSSGLFRDLPDDQLYQLYDSELYACGGYDEESATRPYLVTTDTFWEVFAAAYQGLFMVSERERAMPAFWKFVASADRWLSRRRPGSPWAQLFRTADALRQAGAESSEARRVIAAQGSFTPPGGSDAIDYSLFQPRGYYDSQPELRRYFRAFTYLTLAAQDGEKRDDLETLPPEVKAEARAWIASYRAFIAPPRVPTIWSPGAGRGPRGLGFFPLGWGFDNRVLDATVYHHDWPAAQQIVGRDGPRLLPSGLDLAAAIGDGRARALEEPEIASFPPLGPALARLARQFASERAALASSDNLYQRWIAALATQEATPPPAAGFRGRLWQVKRLQTSLASWATLRHTTVLVNATSGAECGEGGFEALVMRPPRGYVEPDPATFRAIAGLFDAAAHLVESSDEMPSAAPCEGCESPEALWAGLVRRLQDGAAQARAFASMAKRELEGEPLSAADYDSILHIGRAAEYNLLVFKSLSNPGLGLSTPEAVPKVADVSGNRSVGYFEAAVGRPMEWDQVVPYFGRREIVKGVVYSYYQFVSPTPLDDTAWRSRLPGHPHPDWVAPFLVPDALPCPAGDPY